MFIQVHLLNGFQTPLWYAVPAEWDIVPHVGLIVEIPIQKRTCHAVIIHIQHAQPDGEFTIKPAVKYEPFPEDTYYQTFLAQLSKYYHVRSTHFLKRLSAFLTQKQLTKDMPVAAEQNTSQTQFVNLTCEQREVTDFIRTALDNHMYCPTVLHGVTGSGKTEVYKELIMHAYTQGKSTLFLLPEVSLAVAFAYRLTHELEHRIPIFEFHSGVTPKQKRELWQRLLDKTPMLIIGVHLPILLPISNLGLMIIDEEHDPGYQEKKHPKINTKEAALMRAHACGIPILLGSATPSLQALLYAKTQKWHFFQLKKRFSGSLPEIKIVDLKKQKARKQFWITHELEKAIQSRLAKKEQTIIFLNRRGFSFFVQCKKCSAIFTCPSCSVSLTLHKNDGMTCHYCSFSQNLPSICIACHAGSDQFLKKGVGTQQMVTILQKIFPHARIARADLDTTAKKKVWQGTLRDFGQKHIDILVGTQTVTKGYDFPGVTLVGIIWADSQLNFPIYNAAETALQQIIQVAGRAGRRVAGSQVIVQTMSPHHIFSYVNELDYIDFCTQEFETRKELSYPPFARFIELEIKHENEDVIQAESQRIVDVLIAYAEKHSLPVIILGPAQPPVHKIKNTYVRKVYFKTQDLSIAHHLYTFILQKNFSSRVFYTPNPLK